MVLRRISGTAAARHSLRCWPSTWAGNPQDRILDLGAGPAHLALLVAPHVAEVVAVEPEPDMLAEGERRARAHGVDNLRFTTWGSDDLPGLRSSLGQFRTALLGSSFHWMLDKDRVLADLSAMIDPTGGSVAFVGGDRVSAPEALSAARTRVHDLLERYLASTPERPHPRARHDPFEAILARSEFPTVETLAYEYQVTLRPSVDALVGAEYTISHVLARLSDRKDAFEREVGCEVGAKLAQLGEVRKHGVTTLSSAAAEDIFDALYSERSPSTSARRSRRTQTMNNDFINAVKTHDYGYLHASILAGQTPNVVGDDGKSALLVATEAHDPSMVQWLLEHGAHVDFYDPDYQILDQTAFLSAGANGFTDILEILIPYEPDVAIRNGVWWECPDTSRRTGPRRHRQIAFRANEGGCKLRQPSGWTALLEVVIFGRDNNAYQEIVGLL